MLLPYVLRDMVFFERFALGGEMVRDYAQFSASTSPEAGDPLADPS